MRVTILWFFLLVLAGSAHASDIWSTAVAERPSDGWKIIYRFIDKLEDHSEKTKYPTAITLTWNYDSPNGLPTKLHVDAIYKLEDLLEKSVERNGEGRLAFISTGNNLRSWTYYVKSESFFRKALAEAVTIVQLELQVSGSPDPQWKKLSDFANSIRR